MAQSSGRVGTLSPAAFSAGGRSYRIDGRELIFEGGSLSIDYFVGSNSAGRSFLHEKDGYLFELPVTWYAQKQLWDSSPGYETDREIRLNRAVEPGCLNCHSSRVRPVLGTVNRYGDPPFRENGVSCERCHGPGSEHARAPSENRMVDPATLEPERRDAVCGQCHLTGEARIERPGRRIAEFQAGDRLSDYATWFVYSAGRSDLKVTSHVEKLAASACQRVSGDKLWCGSCHDPHGNANKTQAACLGCHESAHLGDTKRRDESCASCHMPRSATVDAGHNVMTDHSIPRSPHVKADSSSLSASAGGGDLKAFLGVADDRALGLAYAERGDPRAREHLLRAEPRDAPVLLRLAVLEKDPGRAADLYRAVLKTNPGDTSALVNLGVLEGAAGNLKEAAALWDRALAANPGIEEAVLNLAQILPAAEARLRLREYLEFNPASSRVRERLAKLH
jgi:hypothetical protein